MDDLLIDPEQIIKGLVREVYKFKLTGVGPLCTILAVIISAIKMEHCVMVQGRISQRG